MIGVMGLDLDYLKHLAYSDDREAVLNDLMQAYGQDVWNYAFVLTKRPDAADDLAQDVFLKAYRQWHTFRGESSVKTWLLSITRHASLNYLKSAFIRKVTLTDKLFSRESRRSAEKEALDRLRVREVWDIVLQLPAKYREVLILDAHYELKESEIADLLGIAPGTVKSRLHRARAKVEKALKEADQP